MKGEYPNFKALIFFGTSSLTDFSNSRTEQQAWCSANSLTYELITGAEEPII